MTAPSTLLLSRDPEGSPDRLKIAIAAGIGTCVENYDFIAYGTAASLYFNAAFFPSSAPAIGTILSFATLAVGFLMRPLGGAVGGFLADRFGRKPVLVWAMLVMGIATCVIGLLPTYGQIGAAAAILLIVVRVIQGLAYGAEWGSAVTMTYEHAPWRRRGYFASIPQSGNYLGIGLASVMFLVSSGLPGTWAWRVPFLASVVLVAVGLVMRFRLSESPEFATVKDEGVVEKNPLLATVRSDWREILQVIGVRIVESFAYYLTSTYFLNYVTTHHPSVKTPALIGLTVSAFLAIPVAQACGALTDRLGRRVLYIAGCVLAILFGFPMFLLTNDGVPALVITVFIIGITVIHASFTGIQGSLLTELFATARRASGASLGYQVAASLAGLAPLAAVVLTNAFGWPGGATLYVLAAVVGLIAILTVRETWGPGQRAEVENLITRTRERDAGARIQ